MTTPFFLWLAVILAGMGVAQLVKAAGAPTAPAAAGSARPAAN